MHEFQGYRSGSGFIGFEGSTWCSALLQHAHVQAVLEYRLSSQTPDPNNAGTAAWPLTRLCTMCDRLIVLWVDCLESPSFKCSTASGVSPRGCMAGEAELRRGLGVRGTELPAVQ